MIRILSLTLIPLITLLILIIQEPLVQEPCQESGQEPNTGRHLPRSYRTTVQPLLPALRQVLTPTKTTLLNASQRPAPSTRTTSTLITQALLGGKLPQTPR